MVASSSCSELGTAQPQLVSVLFLIRKLICVVLRRNRSSSSGAVLGESVCTHVLYSGLYSCLIRGLGADPLTELFIHLVEVEVES